MVNFISMENFQFLYKTFNNYSRDKHQEALEFKKYKQIIGNTMEEIYRNYKNISIEQGNKLVSHVVLRIVDKNMESKFFEQDMPEESINNLENLTPVVDGGYLPDEELKIRPVFERRFDKMLQNNNYDNISPP